MFSILVYKHIYLYVIDIHNNYMYNYSKFQWQRNQETGEDEIQNNMSHNIVLQFAKPFTNFILNLFLKDKILQMNSRAG